MSEATPTAHEHEHHTPHLAHHFDTLAQQYASAKLGMWVFLGTEILMFGGLFCAYGVYRYSHPEVFSFAHRALDERLGAINTVVLISSSLTMALAVRFAQMGRKTPLLWCLALTILGGAGFMVIKSIEYETKWKHHLFPGTMNVFNQEFAGKEKPPETLKHGAEESAAPTTEPAKEKEPTTQMAVMDIDPLHGTPDEPKIRPSFVDPPGLSEHHAAIVDEHDVTFSELSEHDRQSVNAFFSVYFMMTGLHGLHVLIGMGLISWIFVRATKGTFGPTYFTPVDLVGLYWHLVDLIWIFLFPLLYLIH